MELVKEIATVAAVGIGATALMDGWALLLKKSGVPTLDYAWVGRWVGHLSSGTLCHTRIADAVPISGEVALGWGIHYAVGILIAALLAVVEGTAWLHAPTFLPALWIGLGTVILPLGVMQPCMGAGFAASRTATPVKNCLRSVLTHAIFGVGLYASTALLAWVMEGVA